MGAMHESDERYPPPLCHPGTRKVVVDRVIIWYLDKSDQRKGIMWVHAPAGFGKTAVAGTVTEKLKARAKELGFDPIGATFFFWRTSPERSSPARFIITLAYQLAESISELRPHVEAAIKNKPSVVKMALELQLVKLIVEPFQSLLKFGAVPNRVVIIDGIDECINSDRESRVKKQYAKDQEAVQIRVLDLIHRLQSYQLPLSFLILSRPEAWIKQHLESNTFRNVVEPLDLYKVGDHMEDVAKFVRAELSRIATSQALENADRKWAEEDKLVTRSKGRMIYASTFIRHIDDPSGDPQRLLNDIVNSSSTTSPDISDSTPFSLKFEDSKYEATLGILDCFSGRSPGCGVKALRPLPASLRLGGSEDKEHRDIPTPPADYWTYPPAQVEYMPTPPADYWTYPPAQLDSIASLDPIFNFAGDDFLVNPGPRLPSPLPLTEKQKQLQELQAQLQALRAELDYM
jgi:hypothetical protein